MSKTVDDRVVSMQFDNRQFESNVKTTLGTLDKLKESLKFEGAAKSLETVGAAAGKCDLSPLSKSVEAVKLKFSAMEVFAVTALTNIANKGISTAKNLFNEFAVKPKSMGFQEYELKMGSIQTIMASTGEELGTVNKYLNELNKYSDQTIYSFADMTQNIGKFTNAGVKLEDAVAAIKGISNEAAISGANSNEASRAMYNFAQALSAGHVKLMDWKSIELANMATVEFKEQLIKSALAAGTLTDAGNGLYKTLGGTTISATKNFNDSLKDEWMTTEVLIETLGRYADENTEIGKKAKAAAQDVKTFSMMMDTLKESAQSGWAQTWEIVFGDFNQAKKLWTELSQVFGDMIQASSDGRNKMLSDWKEAGGRTAIVKSVRNMLKGLTTVLTTVKEAWREVFPPTTGKQLADICKAIQNVTKHFKLNKTETENLKKILVGLFSVLDIGVTFVKALAGGIATLIGGIASLFRGTKDLNGGLLETLGSFGEWLSGIRDSIKESNVFGKAVDAVVGVLQKGIEKLKEFKKAAGEKFKMPGFEDVINVFKGIGKWFTKIGQKISEVGSAIGDAFSEAFHSGDIAAGLDIINGGILSTILLGIKKFVGDVGGLVEGIGDILDGVKGCLEAWQQDLKANVLIKIAGAIAILTASLVVLSLLNQDKLTTSLKIITVLFADLMGSLAVFSKFSGDLSDVGKATAMMIAVSTAVLILSSAVKKIAGLDPEAALVGVSSIVALTGAMVGAMLALSNFSGDSTKGAMQMLAFAGAIKILSSAVKTISELDPKEALVGIGGVLTLIGAMSMASIAISKFGGDSTKGAMQMLAFAAAIKIIATVVKEFSGMSLPEIGTGLLALAGTLVAVTVALKFMPKDMVGTGLGLIAVAAALKIMVSALQGFGGMSLPEIGAGLLALAGALAAVTVAVNFMPKNMISIGAGLIAVSAAILIMAKALSSMSNIEHLGVALGALGGSMAILAIGLNVMNGTLPGSAALLVASASIIVLSKALDKLGTTPPEVVSAGLITMAKALGLLGVAGLVLSPVVPAILGLGAAMALIGMSIFGVGAGLMLVSAGLNALAIAGTAGAVALTAAIAIIVSGLLNLLPVIVQKLGEAIILFCEVIVQAAPTIGEAVKAIVLTIIDVLVSCVPALMDAFYSIITSLLVSISEYMPTMVQAGCDILIAFLTGIRDNIGEIVTLGAEIICSWITALGEKLPDIVNAGIEFIIAFIDGLGQGLEDNSARMGEAIVEFCEHLIMAVCNFFGIHSPSKKFIEIGIYLIEGLIKGIGNMVTKAKDAIVKLCTSLISAIKSKAKEFLAKGKELVTKIRDGITSKASDAKNAITKLVTNLVKAIKSKAKEFLSKGKELISKLKDGITAKASAVKTAVTKCLTNAVNGIKDKVAKFKNIGKNLIKGLKEGIKEKAKAVVNAAKGVVNNAIDAAKNLLGIHSPSRVFKEIGRNVDEGFVIGLKEYASKVKDASEMVGKAAIGGISKSLSQLTVINKAFGEDINEIAKTMEYGSGAFKAFANTFVSKTDNIEKNRKALDGASAAITEYAKHLYLSSDAYKQEQKAVEDSKEAIEDYKKLRTKNYDELASEISSMSKLKSQESKLNKEITQSEKDTTKAGKERTAELKKELAVVQKKINQIDIFKEAQEEVNSLEKKNEEITSKISALEEKNAKTSKKKIDALNEEKEANQDRIDKLNNYISLNDEYTKGIEDQTLAYKTNVAYLEENQKALDKLIKKRDASAESLKKEQAAYNEAVKRNKQLEKELAKARKDSSKAGAEKVKAIQSEIAANNNIIKSSKKRADSLSKDLKKTKEEIKTTKEYIEKQTDALSDSMKQFYTELHTSISDKVSTLLDPLSLSIDNGIKDIFESFKGVGTTTGSYIGNLFEAFDKESDESTASILNNMRSQVDGVKEWKDNLEKVANAGFDEGLVKYLKDLGVSGAKTVALFASMTEEERAEANKIYAESLEDIGVNFGKTAEDILDSMQSQVDGVSKWKEDLESLSGKIGDGLLEKLRSLGPEAAEELQAFTTMTQEQLDKANELFEQTQKMSGESLLEEYSLAADKAEEWASKIEEVAKAGFDQSLLEDIGNKSVEDGLAFMDALLSLDESQIAQFNADREKALTIPTDVADRVIAAYAYAGTEDAQAYRTALMTDLKEGESTDKLSETLVQVIKDASRSSKKQITKSGENTGTEVMEGVRTGINSKSNNVKTTVSNVLSNCVRTIRDKYDKFYKAGGYLVKGFAKGIEDNTDVAVEAASAMAEDTYDATMEELDAHSPSRLFTKVGSYIPAGMAIGISKFSGTVKNAASDMANAAVDTTTSIVSNLAAAVNDGMEVHPTISPVVDSSNLEMANLDLTADISTAFLKPINSLANVISNAQAAIDASNQQVVASINGLREDLVELYNADDKEFALYLDTKKVASSLAKPMNKQLNILSQRGAY